MGEDSASPTLSPSPRSNANGYLIAGFTVLLVIMIILWYTAPQWEGPLGLGPKNSTPAQSFVSVNITEWTYTGPAACWQGSVFSYGGTVSLGGIFHGSVNLPYPGGLTGPNCTAQSVQVLTPGFVLQGSNVPVVVSPGGAGRLFVNVTVPGVVSSGPLSMTVTTVSP
jgi:hypothetical protein